MIVLLLACAAPESEWLIGDPDDSTSTSTETATGDLAPIDITAELAVDVVTVVRVRWSTVEPSVGFVRFSAEGTHEYETPVGTEPSTEHEALLLGMPADSEVTFRVVSVEGGATELASAPQSITTGSLPAELPTMSVAGEVVSWVGEFQVLPIQGGTFAIVIIDDQGRIVWYDIQEPGFNLMRAGISADRQSMLYCLAGPQDAPEVGVVSRVTLDGADTILTPFPYMDHDMAELPDGTIAAINLVEEEGHSNYGDRIVELSPSGDYTSIWNAWDDAVLAPYYREERHNWTHANALDYDPVEDVYYISLKELGTIVKVDRATGQSLWHLNGMANEFTLTEGTELVLMQHQFQVLPEGILIFDNGLVERGYSRAVELAIDYDNRVADEVWSYIRDPAVGVYAKGDVERFADGNTQVVWSTSGEIQNVTPEGEVLWSLGTDLGYAITFVQHVRSLYVAD